MANEGTSIINLHTFQFIGSLVYILYSLLFVYGVYFTSTLRSLRFIIFIIFFILPLWFQFQLDLRWFLIYNLFIYIYTHVNVYITILVRSSFIVYLLFVTTNRFIACLQAFREGSGKVLWTLEGLFSDGVTARGGNWRSTWINSNSFIHYSICQCQTYLSYRRSDYIYSSSWWHS